MAAVADDPRVQRGLAAQLAARRRRLEAGGRPLGWKVGFGAPAAMAKLGIAGPLTGFMLADNRVDSAAACSLAGWTKPVAEPEIAVHISQDVRPSGSLAAAAGAIGALGPAIELADLTFPPEDVERILAGNIYHRHVILGPADGARAGGMVDGLTGRVLLNGKETASTRDLEANTGLIVDIVRHVADTLGRFGETLKAGDVIIAGSVVAPIFLTSEHREMTFALDPVGQASVRFA